MSAEANQSGPGDASGDQTLLLGGRYKLMPEVRLPQLDSPHAQAYEAHDLTSPARPHFALLCRAELAPRIDAMERFARLESDRMLKPLRWGVVPWAPDGGRRYAIVFPRPRGERLLPGAERSLQAMSADAIKRAIIVPLLPVLKDLSDRMLTHRAIRAENLFYVDDQHTEVMLGECVSAPPGLAQPAVYETIEGGMAQPSGRGQGSPADDFYALGVLLAVLLSGGDPCAGMADSEVVATKLRLGSYSALLAKARVPLSVLEPLRGLLCDDPSERWTARELKLWVRGHLQTPKQVTLPPKAARPLNLAGAEYLDARSFAHAMANDWPEAVRAVGDMTIAKWVERSLGDHRRAKMIGEALRPDHGAAGESGNQDQVVARVLAVLDPWAPIRYKGFAAKPDGLGQALAMDYDRPERVQLFAEMMRGRVPQAWFESQMSNRPEFLLLKRVIEQAGILLRRARPGFGIERCLYHLSPAWPCQSPLLGQDYVCDIKELLPALERVAGRGLPTREPVDGHIASFCAVHAKYISDRYLDRLASDAPLARHPAMLQILAEVQRRTGPARLPALARWFASLLGPSVESYHHRPYRKQLSEELERLVERGVLSEMSSLFDSGSARLGDEQGFAAARAQYKQVASYVSWLEQDGLTSQANVMRASRQAASVVSALLSGFMLVALTLLYVI